MTTTTNKISHTADHTEDIAKESAQEKKSGNTKRLLFQNLPIIKQIGGLLTGAFGIVETTGDALYRTLSLVARPQDIKNTDKIIKNGIKTVIGEKKIEEGKKKYIKPKLAKDFMQYSNPDLEETKYFDTQGTNLSLAPKKSDNRFKKIIKGIPFISGKIIKAPVRAANTIIGGITDIFRFMKKNMNPEIKEDSKGHYLKHYYPRYYKAKHAWKNLTSRAYKGNTSGQNTIQDTKEEADTNQKKSRRSRIRPFGKKKSKQETKESETTENKKEVTLPSTPPKESKPDVKKETIQEKDIIKEEKSTDKKEKSTESKDEVDIMKDYTTSFKSIKPLKTAFQQKNKEELEKHKNIILETNTEIIEEDYENLNPTQQKIIDDIKAVQKRIKNGEYEISEGEVETITNDQRELLKNGHNNIKEYKKAVEEKNKNNFNQAIDKIGRAEEAFRQTDSSKLSEEEQSMLQDIKETLKEIRETKFDDTRT